MQDEDIWVDVEELDERMGERKKRLKLPHLRKRMKEKEEMIALDVRDGQILTPEELEAKAREAAAQGKVLEVRTVPPVRGG